jgi:chromosome segregation ATPase
MDEHLEVLQGIWGEMKGLNGRVNATNDRLDALRSELKTEMAELKTEVAEVKTEVAEVKTEVAEVKIEMSELRSDLRDGMGALRSDLDLVHRRSVDRDLRLGTALTELSRGVRELTLIVDDWRDEHRLDRQELRARVGRLERRVGLEPL